MEVEEGAGPISDHYRILLTLSENPITKQLNPAVTNKCTYWLREKELSETIELEHQNIEHRTRKEW